MLKPFYVFSTVEIELAFLEYYYSIILSSKNNLEAYLIISRHFDLCDLFQFKSRLPKIPNEAELLPTTRKAPKDCTNLARSS